MYVFIYFYLCNLELGQHTLMLFLPVNHVLIGFTHIFYSRWSQKITLRQSKEVFLMIPTLSHLKNPVVQCHPVKIP